MITLRKRWGQGQTCTYKINWDISQLSRAERDYDCLQNDTNRIQLSNKYCVTIVPFKELIREDYILNKLES